MLPRQRASIRLLKEAQNQSDQPLEKSAVRFADTSIALYEKYDKPRFQLTSIGDGP
ncbi:MAG: hypothetical protein K2X03_23590 [Bryobacteraceae bacterium]|nr:hypothetical protein [Bryobacteraceae bacterium]